MTVSRVRDLVRRVAPLLGLLVLAASLVVAADLFGTREALFGSATPAPRAAAFSRVDSSPAKTQKTVLRSQPWWQLAMAFDGVGRKQVDGVKISDGAIQWRMKWRCKRGRFVVRSPAKEKPLIDSSCAKGKSSELTEKPPAELQIEADGRWKARLEQQVDVPLIEPPLRAMTAPGTTKVASGAFYRIDQTGKGRVTIYRLASGRYALRLQKFYTSPNIDLEIRLSPLVAPHSTRQYLSTPAALAAPLDITTGSMNFVLPAGVDPTSYRSVVIWCPLITSAYAATTLKQQ